jgi:hypothetical protein
MRMRTYVAVAVNIIGRSVTAMGTRALQWKGDRTAMQRRQDCSGKTQVTVTSTQVTTHAVAHRESYKVFGGVLYSGSEW